MLVVMRQEAKQKLRILCMKIQLKYRSVTQNVSSASLEEFLFAFFFRLRNSFSILQEYIAYKQIRIRSYYAPCALKEYDTDREMLVWVEYFYDFTKEDEREKDNFL